MTRTQITVADLGMVRGRRYEGARDGGEHESQLHDAVLLTCLEPDAKGKETSALGR